MLCYWTGHVCLPSESQNIRVVGEESLARLRLDPKRVKFVLKSDFFVMKTKRYWGQREANGQHFYTFLAEGYLLKSPFDGGLSCFPYAANCWAADCNAYIFHFNSDLGTENHGTKQRPLKWSLLLINSVSTIDSASSFLNFNSFGMQAFFGIGLA